MTTREVEKLSLQISQSKGNPDYYISHAWLTDIENGKFTPSIYKLYSLSTIYRSRFAEMLGYFGLNLTDFGINQTDIRTPQTQLLLGGLPEGEKEEKLPVPDVGFPTLAQTKTLLQVSDALQMLPFSVLQYLNSRDKLLGYVGLQDFTLYPLVRPGSFVEIDSQQNKIRPVTWTDEYNRPIYFVELRERYVCSWCELGDRQLSIVPHPISGKQIERFKYPDEAEIVGRVTAVAMRIGEFQNHVPQQS